MKINIEKQEAEIRHLIAAGESSRVEFKEDTVHNDRIAIEISAFANFKGGLRYCSVYRIPEKLPG